MKRMVTAFCFFIALSSLAWAQGGEMMKSEKKSSKKAAAAPTNDADIQKCITDKLAKSEKLSTQGLSATVSNGEATLTGTAKNAGSKGAATKMAKSCGASKVTNNITSPPVSKPKKSEDAKPAEKKG
ncbi:MAG TPA: BON domain-containing protein [Blastocatellia bacterium]|nr:BON domain-containing protein [Blastocatellia bacterium]